ncbi:MAG: co-chaperone GroES [Gammaproteobacteria bacterium]
MNLQPLGDRIIVSRDDEETVTEGGIVIPDTASKDKPMMGKVLAVGPGALMDSGERRAMGVSKGDKVLFGKYAGSEVEYSGEHYLVLREDDVMAIVQ